MKDTLLPFWQNDLLYMPMNRHDNYLHVSLHSSKVSFSFHTYVLLFTFRFIWNTQYFSNFAGIVLFVHI